MAAPTPTKREIALVTLLLACVLILSRAKTYLTDVPPTLDWTPDEKNHSSIVHPDLETQIPRNLDTRLSWGSSHVPSTRILAHVPGAFED